MLFGAMLGTYFGTIALFLIDTFSFDERELGTFMLVVGVFIAFNQAFLSKRFIKKFGEFPTLILGLLFCAIGLFTITLTNNLYLFIVCYYFMNLGLSLCFPTFNALISIHADEQNKGEILGISESIMSLNLAVFPFIAAFIYHILEDKLFHITALLPLAGGAIALIALKKLGKKSF
jgi:MFS family permease